MLQRNVKLTAVVTSHCRHFVHNILHVAESYEADSIHHTTPLANSGIELFTGVLHIVEEDQANSSHRTLGNLGIQLYFACCRGLQS